MEAHLHEPLDTHRLATQAKLSPSHLSRLFRLQTGRSPYATLRLKRLQKAEVLLGSTLFAVKEVAFAVGYHDMSHFVKDFRHLWGSRPLEHRRQVEPRGVGHTATASAASGAE